MVTAICVQLESGEERTISVLDGSLSLSDALSAGGFPLNNRCGKHGNCRSCEVELRKGAVVSGEVRISAPAIIRACQSRPSGRCTIFVPERACLMCRPKISDTFTISTPHAHRPIFPSGSKAGATGFAVDVGTTTVVVALVDLASGKILARASGLNQQIRFGDNVITRIAAARDLQARAQLQRAVVAETIRPLLMSACRAARRDVASIVGGTVAGNTTMLHLLAGEDPTSLGVAPFTPGFIAGRRLSAASIHLVIDGLRPETPVQLLPGIAAYLGADICAGMVACGIAKDRRPSLLIDIGTNGEMVLHCGDQLMACATAAGPAFEGCGLSCGTFACDGVVSTLHMAFDPFRLKVDMIGGATSRASGICGSGYVDFLATGKQCGLLNAAGRFNASVWQTIPAQYKLEENRELALVLAKADTGECVRISETDIALLLQAKAALATGIEVLLEAGGLEASGLGCVYVAGGFGMHLDVANAIAIGVLPGVSKEQVRVIGNAALAGACLALVDRGMLEEMDRLRSRVKVIELNLTNGFEDRYIEHLVLQ